MVEDLEFRLAAHREILVAVLAALARHDDVWTEVRRALDQALVVQDHEEDPGIVPSEAFARQNAMIAEITSMLQDAATRAASSEPPVVQTR